MASYTVPPIYAAFVWWFSTGAVLLLVGRSGRFEILRAFVAGGLLAGSLGGLALTSRTIPASPAPMPRLPAPSCSGARRRSRSWQAG